MMRKNIFHWKSVMVLLSVVLLGLAWMGCSTTVKERQRGQPVTEATGEAKAEGEGMGKYYLDDVRVPSELNYKANKSFVYETQRFKAGLLHFTKWRLDALSLIDFFTFNMEKDHWKLGKGFKGKEAFLHFLK